MTRDDLVTALRGIIGHGGTLTEDRVLAQIDTYVLTAVREAAAEAIKSATQEQYGDAIRTASQVFWDAAKPALMDEIGAEVEGQIAVRETIIRAAERERIRQQIDPDRLDKLADWFDSDDEFKVAMFPGTWPERGREVQADLRRWASVIREVP